MFKKKDSLKIHTYLTSNSDINDVPWEERTRLKPMTFPDWFKKIEIVRPYDGKTYTENVRQTIKTCPSYTNMLKNGYVINTKADLLVKNDNGKLMFREMVGSVLNNYTTVGEETYTFHYPEQLTEHYPYENGWMRGSVKFINGWQIRANEDMTIMFLPCWWDKYYNNIKALHGMVHLPKNFDWSPHINTIVRVPPVGHEYLIPANTPIAHVFAVNVLNPKIIHDQSLWGDITGKRSRSKMMDLFHYTCMSKGSNFLLKMFKVPKHKKDPHMD